MFGRSGKGGKEADGKARSAFEREALPHLDAVYSTARYLSRDDREAEDLSQETFLKAWRHWQRYEPGTNCRAWLMRILTNTFYNRVRGAHRELTFLEDVDHAPADASTPDALHRIDPEAQFASLLVGGQVRDAIATLPPDFRTAVVLADLEELSYKEIADIMDCPVGTVMSRIYRGRQLLKKRLHGLAVQQGLVPATEAAEGTDATAVTSLEAYRAQRRAGMGAP